MGANEESPVLNHQEENYEFNYETHLGFVFTNKERADLVAFLKAL